MTVRPPATANGRGQAQVTFPYPGAGVSENAYQVKCGGGGVLSIFTNFTASPDQALQVAASPIAASLGFGLPGGVPVRLYAHQDPATGAALPGVFLGAQNTSTWGVAYAQYFSTDGSGLMMARLLGPNTPLQPGGQYLLPLETPVFLRLDA